MNLFKEYYLYLKNNGRLGTQNFLNQVFLRRWLNKNRTYKLPIKQHKIRKVIFLASDPYGTVGMNGHQISDALIKRGVKSEVYTGHLPDDIKDCLIIFIKYFPYKDVVRAIKNNCLIVYDVLDDVRPNLLRLESKVCNGIIFPNKRMATDFESKLSSRTKPFVIYHHWDLRLHNVRHRRIPKKFSVAYFGSNPDKNALHHKELGVKTFLDFKNHLRLAKSFSCLYSVRGKGTLQLFYKPSTKVVTAAAINTNIITSKESSAVELVGENYPYLTDSDIGSVKDAIRYAKETLGGPIWKKGLKIMERVKKKTHLDRIAKDYHDMIKILQK